MTRQFKTSDDDTYRPTCYMSNIFIGYRSTYTITTSTQEIRCQDPGSALRTASLYGPAMLGKEASWQHGQTCAGRSEGLVN